MLENKVLWRIFGPNMNEQETAGNCIMKRCMICTPHKILLSWGMKWADWLSMLHAWEGGKGAYKFVVGKNLNEEITSNTWTQIGKQYKHES
jgi:hypothetical protein